MMGTLARFLAKHGIATGEDRYRTEAEGEIASRAGVLKIVALRVHYFLRLPPEKEESARECLSLYLASCPAAQSVKGCIDLTHDLTLETE
jgi:organic hydroperoxide reductase OsmC/OhrA